MKRVRKRINTCDIFVDNNEQNSIIDNMVVLVMHGPVWRICPFVYECAHRFHYS